MSDPVKDVDVAHQKTELLFVRLFLQQLQHAATCETVHFGLEPFAGIGEIDCAELRLFVR